MAQLPNWVLRTLCAWRSPDIFEYYRQIPAPQIPDKGVQVFQWLQLCQDFLFITEAFTDSDARKLFNGCRTDTTARITELSYIGLQEAVVGIALSKNARPFALETAWIVEFLKKVIRTWKSSPMKKAA